MSKTKVEENHLNQRPILLIVVVLDEGDFQLFKFLQPLWYFSHNKHPQEDHKLHLSIEVDQQNQNIDCINDEVAMKIVVKYFFKS